MTADDKLNAARRWRAVVAFNSTRLTPTARAVGIALITTMDARTEACFPSESRIAAQTEMSVRAVKMGKAELKAAGLIDWANRGWSRHVSRYSFNWAEIDRWAEDAEARARRHNEEPQFPVNEEPQSPINEEPQFPVKGADSAGNREISGINGELQCTKRGTPVPVLRGTPVPPNLLTELPQGTSSLDVPQADGSAVPTGNGLDQSSGMPVNQPHRDQTHQPAKGPETMTATRAPKETSEQRLLNEAFKDRLDLLCEIEVATVEVQREAARLLQAEGVEVAGEYLWRATR